MGRVEGHRQRVEQALRCRLERGFEAGRYSWTRSSSGPSAGLERRGHMDMDAPLAVAAVERTKPFEISGATRSEPSERVDRGGDVVDVARIVHVPSDRSFLSVPVTFGMAEAAGDRGGGVDSRLRATAPVRWCFVASVGDSRQQRHRLSNLTGSHARPWRGRKAIEERAAGRGVGADVRRVDEVARAPSRASSSARLMVSRASHVGPNTEQICVGAVLEALERILTVVENHAAERVIDAVVRRSSTACRREWPSPMICTTAVAADATRNRLRLGENLDRLGETAGPAPD